MTTSDILNESDYDAGIERVSKLMDAKAGTSESDELDILASEIERYEKLHYPIAPPTPEETARFRNEQQVA